MLWLIKTVIFILLRHACIKKYQFALRLRSERPLLLRFYEYWIWLKGVKQRTNKMEISAFIFNHGVPKTLFKGWKIRFIVLNRDKSKSSKWKSVQATYKTRHLRSWTFLEGEKEMWMMTRLIPQKSTYKPNILYDNLTRYRLKVAKGQTMIKQESANLPRVA